MVARKNGPFRFYIYREGDPENFVVWSLASPLLRSLLGCMGLVSGVI